MASGTGASVAVTLERLAGDKTTEAGTSTPVAEPRHSTRPRPHRTSPTVAARLDAAPGKRHIRAAGEGGDQTEAKGCLAEKNPTVILLDTSPPISTRPLSWDTAS